MGKCKWKENVVLNSLLIGQFINAPILYFSLGKALQNDQLVFNATSLVCTQVVM